MKKVAALTLGCKVNTYDTEAMLELFLAKGYTITDFSEAADIYLINTCTVTNLGDKKSRQMLRQAIRRNPEAIVVASGCYAQVAPNELKKIEGINLIIGTKDRSKIVELVEAYHKDQGTVSRIYDIRKEQAFEGLKINRLEGRTRAYVKIQEGCDSFCSYCIVPYARGPVRSRPIEDILEEIERLSLNGFKEIVLTGIQVSSYGKDLVNTDLLDLLKSAHQHEGIKRLRLSSLDPALITKRFLQTAATLPKLCEHFHLSLQSGCDDTLKRMNRRYTSLEYAKAADALRRLRCGVSLTTDIIVGFPGESTDEFKRSLEFVGNIGFSSIHVFPYSPKKGTKAATFPQQIEPEIKQERLKQMMALGNELSCSFLDKMIGQTLPVLFENVTKNFICEGYTSNYCKVSCQTKEIKDELINEIIPVKITNRKDTMLFGDIQHHSIKNNCKLPKYVL